MIDKPITAAAPIHALLARRWSGRAYDAQRPVARPALTAVLEAARWAPSCYGDEPWRLLACDKQTDSRAWEDAFSCLAAGNQAWAQHAPVLILAVAAQRLRNGEPNRWGGYDTGAAMMSLCLQATALGLMCHQMGGFDAAQASRIFNIPDEYVPMSMMALGYQLAEADIPAALAGRELAARQRRPLADNFFAGAWGRAYVPDAGA